MAALGLCGGLFARFAYCQQTTSGLGARSVSLAPQRLPIWGPSGKTLPVSPQRDRSLVRLTRHGNLFCNVECRRGRAGGTKVGGLLDHCPVNHGPIPEPVVTEGPGNDLMVVLPPTQEGLPLVQPGVPLAQPCRPTLWLDASYLLWWVEGTRTPALVTSGTGASTGILGEAGTEFSFQPRCSIPIFGMGFAPTAASGSTTPGRSGSRPTTCSCSRRPSISPCRETAILFWPGRSSTSSPARKTRTSLRFRTPRPARSISRPIAGCREEASGSARHLSRRTITGLEGMTMPAHVSTSLQAIDSCSWTKSLLINESYETAGPTQFSLYDSFATENTFHGANLGAGGRGTPLGASRWNS